MPVQTLIVDDEYLALNLLENFIQRIPDLELVGRMKSPVEALQVLQDRPVDLLFLDIQMPLLSGNNLLRAIPHPPATIFTTAYADYAIEAFDLNVVDYLLKPFSFERFVQAVQKARNHIQSGKAILSKPGPDFFLQKVDGRTVKIFYRDIVYIEGLREYIRIHCADGRKYVLFERLKNIEAELPQDAFLRVHKSYIVAIERVQAIEGYMLDVEGASVPVSRSKKEEVWARIFKSPD